MGSYRGRLLLSVPGLTAGLISIPAYAATDENPAAPAATAATAAGAIAGQATTAADQSGQDSTDQKDKAAKEVIVTGIRASIIKGLNNKRENTQIIESVVAEDIGKLPDNNVADALQRVTGVQVTNRTGGEATAVYIRGFPDFTTLWNGRAIFTADSRQFAVQDIPANLVSRIDVYKTRSAEQIPTGIGGEISVFTHRPFDFKGFTLSVEGRGIYNETADKVNPNVSALISDRWTTNAGEIGVLVNVSYYRNRYRDQSITAGALVPFATADNPPLGAYPAAGSCPGNWTPLERIFNGDCRAPGQLLWQPGLNEGLPETPGSTLTINGKQYPYLLSRDAVFADDVYGDRKRPAVNAALQWAPNSSSTYTAEFFWDGFRQSSFSDLHFSFVDWWGDLGPDPASTIELYPGTNIVKSRSRVGSVYGFNSGDLTTSKTDSFVYALNGDWHIGDHFHLVSDLSYQKSKFTSQFFAMRVDRVARGIAVDFNTGSGIPGWDFLVDDGTGNLVAGGDALLTDPSTWNTAQLYDNANYSRGDAKTWTTDGTYTFDGGFIRDLKGGFRYDDRGAQDGYRTQSTCCGLGISLAGLPAGATFINSDFFQGRADVPSSWAGANPYWLLAHADEIRQMYNDTGNPGNQLLLSDQLSNIRTFTVDEKTAEGYLVGDFEASIAGRPLKIQAGARLLHVSTDMNFHNRLTNEDATASKSVTSALPDAMIRYDVTPQVTLRASYGETLRRPNFADLDPNYNLTGDLTGVGYGTGSGGNPDLKPTTSKNYDLGVEWYFSRNSALYGTWFRRDIKGLVVTLAHQVTIANSGQNTSNFVITQPVNASNGTLKGFELGYVFFPRLPGFLNGLGSQGSFTWLTSSQNIPDTNSAGDIIGQERSPFFFVSKFSYNITLAYDHGPLGARLSWVWRSRELHNYEARIFANPIGVWYAPEKSLDFQLSYDFSKQLAITADATNLTNEIGHSYYQFGSGGSPTVSNFGSWIYGRTFALGARFKFD